MIAWPGAHTASFTSPMEYNYRCFLVQPTYWTVVASVLSEPPPPLVLVSSTRLPYLCCQSLLFQSLRGHNNDDDAAEAARRILRQIARCFWPPSQMVFCFVRTQILLFVTVIINVCCCCCCRECKCSDTDTIIVGQFCRTIQWYWTVVLPMLPTAVGSESRFLARPAFGSASNGCIYRYRRIKKWQWHF